MVQFSIDDLRTPESIERVLRQFQSALGVPAKSPEVRIPSIADIAAQVAPLMSSLLQAPGLSPLNLTALLPAVGSASVIEDTHANRLTLYPASGYGVGTLFYETDRTVLYVVYSSAGTNVWQYVSGMDVQTFAGRPTDLSTNDRGYRLFVTVQCHVVWWSGAAWFFPDGAGGYFQDFVATPPGALGWQLCDGTATDYLVTSGADLAVTAFTTPNLTGAPSGVYRKSIAAYTGTINAATAGAMSGVTAVAATGITVGAHAVTQITDVAGANEFAINTAGDAAHVVTDPQHQHTFGTIAVDATGQPRNIGAIPYFRR